MSTAAPIGIAVIGLGFGRRHAEALAGDERARIVVVCDSDAGLTETVSASIPGTAGTTDWRAAIAVADVDAVVVSTPVFLHREMVLMSLHAGKDVLCEKPLGLNYAEAASLASEALAYERVNMVNFGFRFLPAVRAVRQQITDGHLGVVQQVNLRHQISSQLDPALPLGWRHRQQTAGMGAMGDLGIHSFDLLRWWLGEIERLTAIHTALVKRRPLPNGGGEGEVDVDDAAHVIGVLAGGTSFSVHVSRCVAGPPRLAGEVYGTRGALRFTRDRVDVFYADDETANINLVALEGASDGVHDRFLTAVLQRTKAEPSFQDAVGAQRAADAAIVSGQADGAWQVLK